MVFVDSSADGIETPLGKATWHRAHMLILNTGTPLTKTPVTSFHNSANFFSHYTDLHTMSPDLITRTSKVDEWQKIEAQSVHLTSSIILERCAVLINDKWILLITSLGGTGGGSHHWETAC